MWAAEDKHIELLSDHKAWCKYIFSWGTPSAASTKLLYSEHCEQMEGTGVSRWELLRPYEKKASGTRKAKGKSEGKAEQSTVRLYKLIKSAPLLASTRSKAIMTKSHYHTEDVKAALHRCSHQQTKNSLFLVDIWTKKRNVLREGNLLSNWDPRNQCSPVPSFLLNQQWQSSGWQ